MIGTLRREGGGREGQVEREKEERREKWEKEKMRGKREEGRMTLETNWTI